MALYMLKLLELTLKSCNWNNWFYYLSAKLGLSLAFLGRKWAEQNQVLKVKACLLNFILNTSWAYSWLMSYLINLFFFLIYSKIITKMFYPSQIYDFFYYYYYYKWIVYIVNKLQIIILCHMNYFANLYNLISSLYKYIFKHVYI